MNRPGVILLVALSLSLISCSRNPAPPSEQTPGQTVAHGQVLIDHLPDGVEGVELAEGGLRLKKGYKLVKDSDSTFAIARMSDGRSVMAGGCGCKGSGGCDPVLEGGIIVCKAKDCSDCGLALTIAGVRTPIIRY